MGNQVDIIVVGVGLVGLVVVIEVVDVGVKVVIVEQEIEVNLGGQVFWLFGGLFMVDMLE